MFSIRFKGAQLLDEIQGLIESHGWRFALCGSSARKLSGVYSKTVKEYYQILVDTLLGYFVEPFKRRQSRQVIGKAPKFYLFDVGVAGAITQRDIPEAKGEQFGRAFEHFVFWGNSSHIAPTASPNTRLTSRARSLGSK